MTTPLSQAPAIDFGRHAEMGNRILQLLDATREATPLHWNDTLPGWVVTRHADVRDGFDGKYPLSNVRFAARSFGSIPEQEWPSRIPLLSSTVPNWIVNSDPPLHTRLRTLLLKAFSRRVVEDMRPFTRALVDRVLLDAGRKETVEFVADVARPIAAGVIMHMLGVPQHHYARLEEWSYTMNTALGGASPAAHVLEACERSLREMREIFLVEIAKRRERPTADFLSQLVLARDGSDTLSEEEMMGVCYLVLVAGHDTTMNSMALGVAMLAGDPQARHHLLAHPERITQSVMEVGRLTGMSTAMPRVAAEDFEWHGNRIERGQIVWLMIPPANRDPRAFADPLRLDLSRDSQDAMPFGGGIHHCIGHQLAKMELGESFLELFRRFDVAVLDTELHFQPTISQRGVDALHVKLVPRDAAASPA